MDLRFKPRRQVTSWEGDVGAKETAAREAVKLVQDGMVLGLGTGSTARYFVQALGERVREGLQVIGIPSSRETEDQARGLGIPLATLQERGDVDLTVDGADEVDPEFHLIKGLGGALVREKILASASRLMAVIVDASKLTDRLGTRAPVPVEVVPFGAGPCRRKLEALGAEVTLRKAGDDPFVSDNGNHVLDARFGPIPDPRGLEKQINAITGVVDNGLFVALATLVVVGTDEGATIRKKGDEPAP